MKHTFFFDNLMVEEGGGVRFEPCTFLFKKNLVVLDYLRIFCIWLTSSGLVVLSVIDSKAIKN